jgi:tRNA uridine 5-carboxymethylaminomethyl modification enzyme
MFTSRAEYRLSLRADNADQRLTPHAIRLGGVSTERETAFRLKLTRLEAGRELLNRLTLTPPEAAKLGLAVNQDGRRRSAMEFLSYPTIGWADLAPVSEALAEIEPAIAEQLETEAVYANYLERQEADILAFRRDEAIALPRDLDYSAIGGLSSEAREKLAAARPATLGQASRIEGITPGALTAVLAHVRSAKRAS